MGNNFAGETRCKALWRFEPSALTVDSKGTNTLSLKNTPVVDTTAPMEGAGCLLIAHASDQGVYVPDASLDAGFPLKTGDATKKITVCTWFKAISQPTAVIIAKFSNAAGDSFLVTANSDGTFSLGWTSGGSTDWFGINHVNYLATGVACHIAIVLDGVAKTAKMRIWDGSTATNYTYTYAGVLDVGASDFYIGNGGWANAAIDGRQDEVVVFNDTLLDAEIDQIRSGTFGLTGFTYAGQVLLTLTPQATYGGTAIPFVYTGQVPLTLTPQAVYEGPAAVPILAIVGSGGMAFNGVGVIALKTPGILAIVGSGGVEFGGQGVIAFVIPPVLAVIGTGGVQFGGRGVVGFTHTPVRAIIGSGGLVFGGAGVIKSSYPALPPALSIIGSGGIVFGGAGVVTGAGIFGPILPPVLSIIGSGGIVFGKFRVPELTVVQFIYPADLTLAAIVGSGGIEFGGTGVITLTMPPVYADPAAQVVADADIFFGGAGVIAFIDPQILEILGDGGVLFGGEAVDPGVFETYVLTGARSEPSIYSNFSFNSYAKYRNQYFGAGPEGVYLLEGEDDAGDDIHSGIRIGPINFGTDREKRLRLLRCGGKTWEAQVRVSNGNGSAGYYDVEGGRAAVSREVQGREITIEISDFESLDHLEIVPLILSKR